MNEERATSLVATGMFKYVAGKKKRGLTQSHMIVEAEGLVAAV